MIRQLKNLAHLCLAVIANILYGFPGKKLRVIGVTGTDGKTTTTSLIYHILKQSGKKTAMITTVGAYVNDQMEQTGFHVTTPSTFTVQKFLKKVVDTDNEFAVIETSSHGIDQNRIWGIPYEVAAITNITHEHLDYHKNFQEYAETKLKFLKSAKCAVINIDDPTIKFFPSKLKNKIITYSLHAHADYSTDNFPVESNLFGDFNKYNTLAAIAVCKEVGINDEQIRTAIKTFHAPKGRQELAYDGGFKVMIDFAHTPNSIENILKEARKTNPKRLIHLFGAPGRRDELKRPLMGQASARYADQIIITADDPRDEKVEKIIQQISGGISDKFHEGKNLFKIEDRKKAIEFAITNAQPGDFILLTGKGHETTLALADQELPWNEKEIVNSFIKK
jgi:UDP-N-acetylmuramoyl-L-alanyl-D-glutamate--2,6-diaminopimelate ligase